jgi:hypothetical protein
VAPASVTGVSVPIITATSVADSSYYATATLSVSGSPIIEPQVLFPANVGTAYAAAIAVTGGTSPYSWTLSGGSLPDGISLAGNTVYYESLSGTPTVTGTFPFQLTVTDADSRTAIVDLTLVVNAASTCLVNGQFALLTTGISSSQLGTRAASITIGSGGTITGILDRKHAGGSYSAQPLTGSCVNRTGNNGEFQLSSSNDSPNLNFAVDANLGHGRLQLTNGGNTATASGEFVQQDASAFSLSQLAGNFAFGLLGADGTDRRMGLVGQLSVDSSGTITAGRADSNADSALNAADLTGSTMSAPDANGRGTLNLSGGGQSFQLAYYVINANRLFLVDIDSGSTPRLAGYMTRRSGGSFSNAALAAPGILSLWGASGSGQPAAVMTLARLSNANSTSGTVDLLVDTADHALTSAASSISGASYSVEADGRSTLSYTAGGATRQFTLYLDGNANGYVIERGSSAGNAGLLEAQMSGPFNRTVPGLFVFGTQFPQSSSPLALLPAVYVSNGSILASSASGNVAINSATGRGAGTLAITGSSSEVIVLYVIQPSKIVVMRFGSTSRNAALNWMVN